MNQVVPLIVIGIASVISVCLYLAGCLYSKEWIPLFSIIPAIFALMIAIYISSIYDSQDNEIITLNASVFFLAVFLVIGIGLPILFYRLSKIGSYSLFMHLGGDLCAIIGFLLFIYTSNDE